MSIKHTNDDGVEIDVYTAEEVTAREAAAVKVKEDEFGKTKAEIEAERDEAKRLLGERAGEFKNLRRLSDDAITKLSLAERTIYENGLALEKAAKDREDGEVKAREASVKSFLKSKAGDNEKLLTKMEDMWKIIGIDAKTPEEIEHKTNMILGAIGTTEPDLIASVAGFSGGFIPKKEQPKEGESFADTEAGKGFASELGLTLEVPKK